MAVMMCAFAKRRLWNDLRTALAVDKKTVAGMPRFVLVSEIGKSTIGNEIPEALMEQLWEKL